MSVPQENSAEISVEPREVMERTSSMPGTRRMASSSGRVTVGIIWAAGSSPESAMTFTMGKVTGGKIDEGSRLTSKTPAVTSTRASTSQATTRLRSRSRPLMIPA